MWLAKIKLRHDYHLDKNSNISRIITTYKKSREIKHKILEVSVLQEYADRDSLKPVHIKDNFYGGDLYFAMLFEEPKNEEDIKKIILGVGIGHNSPEDTFWEANHGVDLWPWANGQIYLRSEPPSWDPISKAEMWFNGVETGLAQYAVRGIALKLYRIILMRLEQEEGKVHHRYEECNAPRIIDTGGVKYSLKGL